MRKFTEVLELYLCERDRQNGDYYENRPIRDRRVGIIHMDELENELNYIVHKAKNELE